MEAGKGVQIRDGMPYYPTLDSLLEAARQIDQTGEGGFRGHTKRLQTDCIGRVCVGGGGERN